ncbi:MAG TPA: cupredoxin family copper-binding protein [Candidatus Acidoferrales bacterium]|nr:cupredoxin family copper-binding protein [Candidatus Acidoferrales bacterium]
MSIFRSLPLAALVALALLGASPTPTASPKPVAIVHIRDFKYNPTPVVVSVGDTVEFINDDDEAHTVTSNDKSFDSGGLDTGETWLHTFAKPGKYAYFCALHPWMKAVVIVKPSAP